MADKHGFENHKHWSAVKDVCGRLRQNGHAALLAGGCVRDFLMNRQPNDFDIATDATPDEVEKLFPKALLIGKAFGVIILPFDGFQLEVATFRQDLEYKDGRRPEGVRFSTPEVDANRRDFTVNALFFDIESQQVIDFVGGQADIKRKIIRTVGDPRSRFTEDKLRLLRAIRFAAQLDFEIAPDTFSAIVTQAGDVTLVSRERVRDEITKLLKVLSRVRGLELLITSGLLEALFPKLSDAVFKNETEWLERFQSSPISDLTASLALFFEPAFDGTAEFKELHLKPLRLDNRQVDEIFFVLKNLPVLLDPQKVREGELILLLAHPAAPSARAVAKVFGSTWDGELGKISLAKLGPDRKKPAAFLTGEDAIAQGLAQGATLGKLLHEAYLLQLEGKLSDRAGALAWLKSKI